MINIIGANIISLYISAVIYLHLMHIVCTVHVYNINHVVKRVGTLHSYCTCMFSCMCVFVYMHFIYALLCIFVYRYCHFYTSNFLIYQWYKEVYFSNLKPLLHAIYDASILWPLNQSFQVICTKCANMSSCHGISSSFNFTAPFSNWYFAHSYHKS